MSSPNELRFTLRQLRAFALAADEGSFTRAAQRLHITQSGLSLLIRDIEDVLGTPLFHRTTRRVELTEAGRVFQPWVRRLLNDLRQGAATVADLRDKRMGILRLAVPQLLGSTVIPAALSLFRQRFPEVSIQLHDFPLKHILEPVESGDAELAIGPDPVVQHPELQREPIFMTGANWLVVRPQDVPARKRRLRWPDLAKVTFIAPTEDFLERLVMISGNPQHPLLAMPRMTVINYTTAFGLVAAGFGVTVSPAYARYIVAGYGLKMIALGDGVMHEVSAWSRKDRTWSPAAGAFLQALREVTAQRMLLDPESGELSSIGALDVRAARVGR